MAMEGRKEQLTHPSRDHGDEAVPAIWEHPDEGRPRARARRAASRSMLRIREEGEGMRLTLNNNNNNKILTLVLDYKSGEGK